MIYLWQKGQLYRGYFVVPVQTSSQLTVAVFDKFGCEIQPPLSKAKDIEQALKLGRQSCDRTHR